jgi:hypothetical protein
VQTKANGPALVSKKVESFQTIKCRNATGEGMSVVFPVELCGVLNVNFVVDTGACVSIMSTAVYNTIPEGCRPKLEEVDSSMRLQVANDGLLEIDGKCEVTFRSSGNLFKCKVFVANIHDDGLIGLDFLYENDYQLSAQNGLRLNGKKCRTYVEKVPLRAVRVTTRAKVNIPPNSECVIPGQAINLGAINTSLGIIVPVEDKQPSNYVTIGSALVSPGSITGNQIPVRLINTSSKP